MCFSSLQIAGTRRVFLAITKRYEYVSFYCECISIHYELLRKSFSPLQRALAVFLVIAFVMVEFKVGLDKVHDVGHDGTQFNNNTQGVWLWRLPIDNLPVHQQVLSRTPMLNFVKELRQLFEDIGASSGQIHMGATHK